MPTLSNTTTVLFAEDLDLNTLLLLLSSSSSSLFPEFGNRSCESSNFQFNLTTFFGRSNIVFGFNRGLGFEDLW
jgi:hypothetical protein